MDFEKEKIELDKLDFIKSAELIINADYKIKSIFYKIEVYFKDNGITNLEINSVKNILKNHELATIFYDENGLCFIFTDKGSLFIFDYLLVLAKGFKMLKDGGLI